MEQCFSRITSRTCSNELEPGVGYYGLKASARRVVPVLARQRLAAIWVDQIICCAIQTGNQFPACPPAPCEGRVCDMMFCSVTISAVYCVARARQLTWVVFSMLTT